VEPDKNHLETTKLLLNVLLTKSSVAKSKMLKLALLLERKNKSKRMLNPTADTYVQLIISLSSICSFIFDTY
jgi:hypothetical protein